MKYIILQFNPNLGFGVGRFIDNGEVLVGDLDAMIRIDDLF